MASWCSDSGIPQRQYSLSALPGVGVGNLIYTLRPSNWLFQHIAIRGNNLFAASCSEDLAQSRIVYRVTRDISQGSEPSVEACQRRPSDVQLENEPDSCGINQTTSYSATQLATWIGGYLGPAMAPLGVKVMGPETQNGCGFTSYFKAIQNDSAAWNSVGIFASHEYGCGSLPSEPSIAAAGKEYWETETDNGTPSGDSNPDDMPSAH
jgi:hypothetical protein